MSEARLKPGSSFLWAKAKSSQTVHSPASPNSRCGRCSLQRILAPQPPRVALCTAASMEEPRRRGRPAQPALLGLSLALVWVHRHVQLPKPRREATGKHCTGIPAGGEQWHLHAQQPQLPWWCLGHNTSINPFLCTWMGDTGSTSRVTWRFPALLTDSESQQVT